jgi:HAE1 family hydrophobic/amphiphilic exporter-1
LKDWGDRNFLQSAKMVMAMIYMQTASIKDAQIMAFAPPMIPGFSATNGLTFSMQDKTGGSVDKFFKVSRSSSWLP